MDLVPTPSQTAGPFFHLGFSRTFDGVVATPDAKGEHIRLICRVIDGDGAPLPDALVEFWQANSEGKYHSADDPQTKPLDPGFRGFGRLATNGDGTCAFETVKPGRVPSPAGALQAPHINISVFGRGILTRLATRIYFSGGPGNGEDPVLALVPADRRDTLMAKPDTEPPATEHPGTWRFDIHLCGHRETVFFDV